MPVDLPRVNYHPDPNGKDTILNDLGETVRGWIYRDDAPSGSLKGHQPHFISCVKPNNGSLDAHEERKSIGENQMSMFYSPAKPSPKINLIVHKPVPIGYSTGGPAIHDPNLHILDELREIYENRGT